MKTIDNLLSTIFIILFIHHFHSAGKTPAYTIHTTPQAHKQHVTTNSYHQTKMPPDQTGRIQ